MSSRTAEMGDPRTIDEARSAVARSRERISSTLDQLEDRIVEKKHELQDRADVLRPVREQVTDRPFTAMAVAIGVGALLGSLGGSDAREPGRQPGHDHGPRGGYIGDDERAELREWRRARRERLRGRSHESERTGSGGSSRLSDMRHQLTGALTTAIGAAVTARIRQMAMGTDNQNSRGDGRSSKSN